MTKSEYKKMIKKELEQFNCVKWITINIHDEITIALYPKNTNSDIDKLSKYILEDNKDKYNFIEEDGEYIHLKMLKPSEGYTSWETDSSPLEIELNTKIKKLEIELQKLKKQKAIKREKIISKNKILKLEKELKKLENKE